MKLYSEEFKNMLKCVNGVKVVCKSPKTELHDGKALICGDSFGFKIDLQNAEDQSFFLDDESFSKMKNCDEDFEISLEDIASGDFSMSFNNVAQIMPKFEKVFNLIGEISEKDLCEALKDTSSIPPQAAGRFEFDFIYLDPDRALGCSSYVCTKHFYKSTLTERCVISKNGAKALVKALNPKSKKAVKIYKGSHCVKFDVDSFSFYDSASQLPVIEIERFFDHVRYRFFSLNTKSALKALKYVKQGDTPLTVIVNDDKVTFRTKGSKEISFVDAVLSGNNEKEIIFEVNRRYFESIIENTRDRFEIFFESEDIPLLIKSQNKTSVIALIRRTRK